MVSARSLRKKYVPVVPDGKSLLSDNLQLLESTSLTFPWGKETFPYSSRAQAYLDYYQRKEVRRLVLTPRLLNKAPHRTRASYQ